MSAFISMVEYHWGESPDLTEFDKKELLKELWIESPEGLKWEDYKLSFEDIAEKCFELFILDNDGQECEED